MQQAGPPTAPRFAALWASSPGLKQGQYGFKDEWDTSQSWNPSAAVKPPRTWDTFLNLRIEGRGVSRYISLFAHVPHSTKSNTYSFQCSTHVEDQDCGYLSSFFPLL